MPKNKGTQDVETADRAARALQLRAAGMTYAEIAEKIGLSESAAYRMIQRVLDAVVREPAEGLIALECQRLDTLHAAVWPKAKAGNIAAVLAALKVSERRSRLLRLEDPALAAGGPGAIKIVQVITLVEPKAAPPPQ